MCEAISLLWQCDAELASHLVSAQVPPYFALSWYITWFAHDMPSLNECARLFDVFLSAHPMLPLYAAAIVLKVSSKSAHLSHYYAARSSCPCIVQAARHSIIRVGDDPAELHGMLNNLPILASLSADELACAAISLYRKHPPDQFLAQQRIRMKR